MKEGKLDNSLKYSCIFGGGAVRGMTYVGAMQAMKELELEINCVAGSSVGAVFAVLFAMEFSVEEIKKIFLEFNFHMFSDLNLGFRKDFALTKGEVFLNWLRENIELKFYKDKYKKNANPPVRFKDIEKNIFLLTSDLKHNEPFVFSKENTPDFEIAQAVKISASMPGLMKPTEYEGKILVDGDLIKSWPLWRTENSLYESNPRVLEFRLEGCKDCVNVKNPLDYFNSVYSTFSNFCTENVIREYNHKDKFDYIIMDTKDVLLVDFAMPQEKRLELIEVGYNTTINYFKKDLVEKKKTLLPYYEDILDNLLHLKSMIRRKKALNAKIKLYELIAEITESVWHIDSYYYKELLKFKELFLNSMRVTLFFDKQFFVNQDVLINELNTIIDKIYARKNELSNYIEKYKL